MKQLNELKDKLADHRGVGYYIIYNVQDDAWSAYLLMSGVISLGSFELKADAELFVKEIIDWKVDREGNK